MIIDRYELVQEIAAGGMATVHLGRFLAQGGFARAVAIKRLHPQFVRNPDFVAMLVDEARLVTRIRHPNVVPILDVIASDSELLLVMEYVLGGSLAMLIDLASARGERCPPDVAVAITAQFLAGLHAAHEAKNEQGEPLGLVHRDVSPQNVLVGEDGVARIADFGIAKAVGRAQETKEGELKGKIEYVSPECLRLGAATPRADVYAASVVLWETLTGRVLFDAATEAAVWMKVLNARVEPPSAVAPGIPPALDAVVLRGLSRDPSARFATAQEMAAALERSSPVAPPSRVAEWVRAMLGETLGAQAATLAAVDRLPASATLIQRAPVAPALPARTRARWILAAALAVATVAGGSIVRRARSSSAVGPTPATSSPPPIASAAPSAEPPPEAPADPSAEPASPSSAHGTTTPKRLRRAPGRECEMPYTVDEAGHKRFQIECLRE